MREMERAISHFPNTRIRHAPDVADVIGNAGERPSHVGIERTMAFAVQPSRLEQVAVNIELRLLDRGVAHTYRPRVPVAGERQDPLGDVKAAVETIERMQPRGGERRRLHEP